MIRRSQIQLHMEVLDSAGRLLGRVDHLEGEDRIRLTGRHPRIGGARHDIPVDWVTGIEAGRLRLSRSAEEAERRWGD